MKAAQDTDPVGPTTKRRPDAYSSRYVLVPLGLLMLAVLGEVLDAPGWLIGLLLLVVLVWLAFSLLEFLMSLRAGRRRDAVSAIAAPMLVWASVWAWHSTGVSSDTIRLLLWRSSYLAEVATHPEDGQGNRFGMWPWRVHSGGLVINPDSQESLVYDTSDQIALPRTSRSPAWYRLVDASGYQDQILVHPERIMKPEAFEKNLRVTRLARHFYLCLWSL